MSERKMFCRYFNSKTVRRFYGPAIAMLLVSGASANAATGGSPVPKWERFEKTFESSVSYANPPQEASLQAAFVSPSGETSRIYGFWDGAKTWRIRFAPNQTGKWTYKT